MATVLVIDDDKIVREAVTDILEIFNVSVLTASNGADGIKLFAQKFDSIDGVIIDRQMPNLNGIETLQKLREIQKDIPVIISSGYTYEDQGNKPSEEKPNAYLYKPYEIQDLIDLVEKVFLK